MALVHIEGFAGQSWSEELDPAYAISDASAVVLDQMLARRTGCYGLYLYGETIVRTIDIGSGRRIINGLALQYTPGTAFVLAAVMSGGTVQASLVVDADGLIHVYRGDSGGTLIASADAGDELDDAPHYIEWDILCDGSAGESTVWIDGVAVIEAGTLNSQVSSATIDGVRISAVDDGIVADWYVIDPNDAMEPTTVIGPTARVDWLEPIATGFPSNFTANTGTKTAAITGEYDGDDTYVWAAGEDQVDLYRVTTMVHSPTTVHGVRVTAVARLSSGVGASIRLRASEALGAGSTTDAGTALTSSYQRASYIVHDADLACATQDEFNALAFGFETA